MWADSLCFALYMIVQVCFMTCEDRMYNSLEMTSHFANGRSDELQLQQWRGKLLVICRQQQQECKSTKNKSGNSCELQ